MKGNGKQCSDVRLLARPCKISLKKMLAKDLPNKKNSSKFGKQKNQRRNQKVIS
jgi:hypothetical protein